MVLGGRVSISVRTRAATVRGKVFSAPWRRINQTVRTCISTSNSPPADVWIHAATCPSRRVHFWRRCRRAQELEMTTEPAPANVRDLWPLSNWQPFCDYPAFASRAKTNELDPSAILFQLNYDANDTAQLYFTVAFVINTPARVRAAGQIFLGRVKLLSAAGSKKVFFLFPSAEWRIMWRFL